MDKWAVALRKLTKRGKRWGTTLREMLQEGEEITILLPPSFAPYRVHKIRRRDDNGSIAT